MTIDHWFTVLLSIIGILVLAWQGWLTFTMLSHERMLAKFTVQIGMIVEHCSQRQSQSLSKAQDDKKQIDGIFNMIRRTERNIARIGSQLGIKDLENPE